MSVVAVIGAGPAGCAAASALSEAGVDVELFERGKPGRDKACGDALLPTAVALLVASGLGSSELAALGGYPFESVDLAESGGATLWRVGVTGGPGWVVRRALLDQALRDRVAHDVHVRYGEEVAAVAAIGPGRVAVRVRDGLARTYDGVVVAAGGGGPIAARLGLAGAPCDGAAIRAYATGLTVTAPRFAFHASWRPGYGWAFPLADGSANVGMCALDGTAARGVATAARRLTELWSIRPGPWTGGACPVWSGNGARWHLDAGVLACGDAAGVADPANGEGITAALESGTRAGAAMSEFVATGDARPLASYSAWVRAHFAERYRPDGREAVWSMLAGTRLTGRTA